MQSLTPMSKSVVLIVDDQVFDLRTLSAAVGGLAEIYIAQRGEDALEIARQCKPDLVLLDIEMPGMNGFDVCKVLKSDPDLSDIAVIFVSAHTQKDEELLALECGGVDFIEKPINIPIARARIKAHIGLRNEAKRISSHDALTGLGNRNFLMRRIDQALESANLKCSRVALLLLNLDNFKFINDAFGYSAGDLVLQVVASRLSQAMPMQDTLSRVGGDEFVLLLPEVLTVEEVDSYAEKLIQHISNPLSIKGLRHDLSVSIGISIYPDDSTDAESLYQHADSAKYQAKLAGRNRYCYYSSRSQSDIRAKHLLERHIRDALEKQVFEIYYQPKINIQEKRIVGLEALIRWRNSDGALISPNEFIPLAEETGLIIPIGKYVLLQACKDVERLRAQGYDISVSVNISLVQFLEESFFSMVELALLESGLGGKYLELELTEGVLAQDANGIRKTLFKIKALGVRISIDDFGTGYSSLAYLKRFPIDILKIDQSFVRCMLADKSDSAIIEAIIQLGIALNLELVAEGVESQAQEEALFQKGCRIMQGYLYCHPIPYDKLLKYLASGIVFDGEGASKYVS